MGLIELDQSLTDEQKAIRDEARRFFMNVWRPASVKLDKLADPRDVIAKDSLYWEVMRKTYELGYHKMRMPKAVGGLELDAMTGVLVAEEEGYASSDFAISLGCHGFPYNFALMSQKPELLEWVKAYCDDTQAKWTGCWAITEPDHGSDWILWQGDNAGNPKVAPQVVAIEEGDHYIINGQKASWVSNGSIASHAALFVTFDRAKGMTANGIAVVPLNLPGVSRGKPLNKIGQRALNQGEIFFDNVKVPKEFFFITDPMMYRMIAEATLASANAGMGSIFTGLAAAAFDEALAYAKQRVQGGRPIIEHQSVKSRIFEMFELVEAARALSRRVILYARAGMVPALHYSIASKVFCTEAAFKVSSMALQIFGGYGTSKEFVIEKLFRDARASMIEDGVNETLGLAAADKVADIG
jgi:alkylation response protein AidB-like acyl-CoA dehydrogenase